MANFLIMFSDKNKSRNKDDILNPKQIERAHDKMYDLAEDLEDIVKWEWPFERGFLSKFKHLIILGGYLLVSILAEFLKFLLSAVTINYTFADLFDATFNFLNIDIKLPDIPWLNDFLNTAVATLPVFELPPHQALRRIFLYAVGGIALIYVISYFIKGFIRCIFLLFHKIFFRTKIYKSLSETKIYEILFVKGIDKILIVAKKTFSFVCLTIALAAAIIHSFYFFEPTVSYWIQTIISFLILMFIVYSFIPKKAMKALAYSSAAGNDKFFITNLKHENISTRNKECKNTISSSNHIQGSKQYSKKLSKYIFIYSFIFSILTILFALTASWIGCDIVASVSLALTAPSFLVRICGRFAPMFETFISQTYNLIEEHKRI